MGTPGCEDPAEMAAGLCGLEVRAPMLLCGGAAAMASEHFPQAGSPCLRPPVQNEGE